MANPIKIALIGNPNCGKTTLFNALTGSNQYVGNWPGVTVEKKFGRIKGHFDAEVVDLPGIYSLSPYSPEETVSRNYLTGAGGDTPPDVILNIVDGSNLERNLFLTTQLLELGIPVTLVVNMMDVVRKRGDVIDAARLGRELGCNVVEISALTGEGVDCVSRMVIDVVSAKEAGLAACARSCQDQRHDQCHRHKQHPHRREFSNEEDRYAFINAVIKDSSSFNADGNHFLMSDRIDRIVTDRYLALPIFAAVMLIMYYVSMTIVGSAATDWASVGLFGEGWRLFGVWIPGVPVLLSGVLESLYSPEWLRGLIVDGVVTGVGAVLGFVPQLFALFIFLAFLEGCGYMARAAFIMDGFFRFAGLSGKSFIPFLIGTGCSVPAIMAARTIEDGRARKMTIIVASFVPCSAKLPVIAMVAGAVFGGAWWVAPSAYFAGVAAIVCSCMILQKANLLGGGASPFVLELPAYKLPTLKSVLASAWERGWSFVKKAGTVILAASVVIWFTSNFGWGAGGFGMVDMSKSILAGIGKLFAWIFAPLGWGNWQTAVAALTGLVAKENIVSTLGILYGSAGASASEKGTDVWNAVAADFTALSAYSFLLFNLLCIPCAAAVGAIKREMENTKWFLMAIGYQCVFAYIASLCVYQFGMMFKGHFGVGSAVALLAACGAVYPVFRRRSCAAEHRLNG